jgi:uncharacterized protein (TIGR02246 family)
MRKRIASLTLTIAGLAAAVGPPGAASPSDFASGAPLSAADVAAIHAAVDAYRSAWLRGDARGVLATLTPDAVLLPAHGAAPVAGSAAIERYWWPPDAPATTITRLDITVENIQGAGGWASVYGRDDVEWTQAEGGATRSHGHPGTYLNVMRRMPDGSWRISRHMWDDGPSH